jgi:hypothetical protein
VLEGWQDEDYLILLDERESSDISAQYELGKYLADHLIVGLRGWDDFIVRRHDGRLATVPTVPIAAEFVAPLEISIDVRQIQSDSRFCGKVKWYTKPVVFGGDPLDQENTIWVTLEEHVQLVKWWNDRYQELK